MAKSRRQRRGLVGVEIYESEIRVVEVRTSAGKPIILAAGSAPMPPNSLVEGEVVRADAVAFALRKLLDNLGVESTDAAIGVPMSGYTTRSLNIPPTPPDEEAMLIEGEVRHFDILRTADGAYDYFPLASSGGPETNIILMAAEGHVTSSLRSVAERAHLEVAALEPVSMAMLRTAAAGSTAADGLYLVVGETSSEASIIRDGQVWLHRRIDVGVNALFASGGVADRVDHTVSREEEVAPTRVRELRKGPADSLGIEVRRTMEFYAREFSGASPVNVVHLLLNDTILEPLEPFLKDATGAEIQVVRPNAFVGHSDSVTQELSGPLAYRYGAAYGLALHGHPGDFSYIPTMDLYVRERSIMAMEFTRKTLAGSLAAAIVAIVLGIAGTYYFGMQANRANEEVDHHRMALDTLRKKQQATLESDRQIIEQISYLSNQGIPAVWFIDALGNCLEAGSGISKIEFPNAASVKLSGEAVNEQSMLLTVQNIQAYPGLGSASIHSFERVSPDSTNPAIKFVLNMARTPGMPQVGGQAQ